MPTTSPIRSEKREAGMRYSSPTRFIEDDDLSAPPLQPPKLIALRLRADSDGSTNNAFFREGHPPLPTMDDLKKQKAKAQKRKKKNKRLKPAPVEMIDVEEGEMTNRKSSRNNSTSQKQQQGGPLPAAIANRLDAIRNVSNEGADDDEGLRHSMRMSEITNGSLLGSGLLDSTRLSEVWKEGSSCEFRDSSKSLQQLKFSARTAANERTTSDLLFTLSDDDDDKTSQGEENSPFEQEPDLKKKDLKFDYDSSLWEKVKDWLNPSPWLISDVKFNEGGTPYFDSSDSWTAAGFFRHYLYNPISPEFTSLQQFWWAVIIGIAMGIYTALWKILIESGVDFVWETIPEVLLEFGVFTDLDGRFPLYHYMWICPMIFGGALSYVFCILPVPIPGQNEWIQNLHARGVQDYRTFWPLFILSTLGMLSGLSLGPELPLVLTAGMFGSWLGIVCQQSMLQARVLNLTAASAAVGGFFGFPMAGALFVLEIPHRMGLQYFEALSPATISSIIAVVTNRIITGNDVTGYFKYPFLSDSLPSQIFTHAIFYGLYGAAIGIVYAFAVIKLKGSVHDWFHTPHHHHEEEELHIDDDGSLDYHYSPEKKPLMEKSPPMPMQKRASMMTSMSSLDSWSRKSKRGWRLVKKWCTCVIPYEPYRAAAAGSIAGALCGIVAIFVPHTLFWGEAQLQNLIDKGRTPLPVFGTGDEPTAALTALGYCIIDPEDADAIHAGFSMQCSLLFMVSKTIVIGLSLGTGIIGGHFWGPLFLGCAAGHFLVDFMEHVQALIGIGGSLAAFPCLVILCTMGAAHVVTFRAHTAIMLILTLTISSFTAQDDNIFSVVSGDYSAVFPLLVISVFVSLMVSRTSVVFYKEQRSRGDITAVPEVLCEPGMQGRPLATYYDGMDDDDDLDGQHDNGANAFDDEGDYEVPKNVVLPSSNFPVSTDLTQDEIEKAFEQANNRSHGGYGSLSTAEQAFATHKAVAATSTNNETSGFSRLDELLSAPIDGASPRGSPASFGSKKAHRRSQSAPVVDPRMALSQRLERKDSATRFDEQAPRERSNSRGSIVKRVEAFGELHEHQPPLLEQARLRAASRELITERNHRRSPSMPAPVPSSFLGDSGRHSRSNSFTGASEQPLDLTVALSLEEIEDTFNAAVNNAFQPKST